MTQPTFIEIRSGTLCESSAVQMPSLSSYDGGQTQSRTFSSPVLDARSYARTAVAYIWRSSHRRVCSFFGTEPSMHARDERSSRKTRAAGLEIARAS